MPVYEATDDRGRSIELEGDSPPTEQDLEAAFKAAYPDATPGLLSRIGTAASTAAAKMTSGLSTYGEAMAKQELPQAGVPAVTVPRVGQEGTLLRGVSEGVSGLVESATTPEGIALTGLLPVPGVGKVIGTAMLAAGAKATGQLYGEYKGTGDKEKLGEALVIGGATVAGATAIGHGTIKAARESVATKAPASGEALADATTTLKPSKEVTPNEIQGQKEGVQEVAPAPAEAAPPESASLGIVPPGVAKLEALKRGNELIDQQRIKTAIAEKDVMPGRDWISSPEFEFRKNPEGAKLATDLNEAELTYKSAVSHDRQRFETLKKPLSTTDQVDVTSALRSVESKADPQAVEKLPPLLKKAAIEIRAFFDEIRTRVQADKIASVMRELSGPQANALRAIQDGIAPEEAFKANGLRESGRAIVQSALDEITDLRKWGIDNYITHIERGSYRVVTPEGTTVAVAETRPEAALKADRWLKENPQVKSVTLTDEFDPGVEFPTQLSRGQYFRLISRLQESLGEDAKAIQNLLHQQGSIVAVKPTKKYAAPLIKRYGVLKGEENVFDVLPLYSHVMRKKLALDPVLRESQTILPRLPKNMRGQMEDLISDVKGRKTVGDRLVDHILSPLGVKPFAYSRGINILRNVASKMKLGYRPVAAAVNRISGLQHTWTKVGTRYLAEGKQFLSTPEGKALLDQNKEYLGIEAAFVHEATRAPSDAPLWHPLGMFQAAERYNRPEAFAAFYKYAEGALGLSGDAAAQYARNTTRFAQFTYNLASLPRAMRGPTGRLLTQFKPYLVKELEFISSLRGAEIPRYLAGFLTVGGPRAALYTIKSLPGLGIMAVWDDVEDWLNRNAPAASRGAAGALGVDVSPSVAFQAPQTPEDFLGPVMADMTRLWKDIVSPTLQGEERSWKDLRRWGARTMPALFYWSRLYESAASESGWITDNRGRPLYQPTKSDYVKLAMGAKPLEMSVQEVEARYLRDTEVIQQRNRQRLIDRYLDANQAKDGAELDALVPDLIEAGITSSMIENAARERALPPNLRLFRSLTKQRRAEEIDRFIEE